MVLLKTGKPEVNLASHRPKSLLAILCKILGLIYDQFGFRRSHGTSEQCHTGRRLLTKCGIFTTLNLPQILSGRKNIPSDCTRLAYQDQSEFIPNMKTSLYTRRLVPLIAEEFSRLSQSCIGRPQKI